jgi:sulfur relay (sulfurtransferase) complex TusBCD TusD component (DsrE family)
MKSRLHLSVGWLMAAGWLGAAGVALGQTTNVVNDGTTVARLTLRANAFGTGNPPATLGLTSVGDELEAGQSPDYSDFPLNGTWFDNGVAPAAETYTVLVDARPVDAYPEYVVGLMAWFDTAAGKGLAFRVVPGTFGSFQVATIDFAATTAAGNDSTTDLYQLDGTPAEAVLGSAWAGLGEYAAGAMATLSLEVAPPTGADRAAVTNATARITARVAQGEAGFVGDAIQLLTTLPVPEVHRFGYFASYGTVLVPGSTIGYLDNLRLVGELRIENQSPVVAITAPADGSRFVVPATVSVTVEASDPEGQLSRIDLYQGGEVVRTANASPAVFAFSDLPVGTHTFQARAVDEVGAVGESTPITIELQPNLVPTVAITAPANGSTYVAPAAVTVTVEANDPEGQLVRVDLYRGGTLVGTANTSPASFPFSALTAGVHTFVARALDGAGQTAESVPVTIEVRPNLVPTVAITAPADGTVFVIPATVQVTVQASDPEGELTAIELYRDDVLVGTANTSPANFTFSDLTAGAHVFVAKAVDAAGGMGESTPVTLQLRPADLPPVVTITAPANTSSFEVPATVLVTVEASDAEGQLTRIELHRDGTLIATAPASPASFPVSDLPVGTYTFVAKAVDAAGGVGESAPVTIQMRPANQLPVVAITAPTNGSRFAAPATVTFAVQATDPEGQLSRIELYRGGTLVGTQTTSPAEFLFSDLSVGTHVFQAKAVDEAGGVGESALVTIELTTTGEAPRLTEPQATPSSANFQEFRFTATGLPSGEYRIEWTTNFVTWTTERTGTITGPTMAFSFPRSTTGNHRFYRLVVDASGPVEPTPRLTGPLPWPSAEDFQQFKFTATGLTSGTYRIEATTNLTSWAVLDAGPVTGPTMEFLFPRSAVGPAWFYRLVLVPGGGGEVTPARLAAPTAAPSRPDFQRFQFRADAMTGGSYRVEQSSNLQDWTPVDTGAVAGASKPFEFPRVPGASAVFYRLVSLP